MSSLAAAGRIRALKISENGHKFRDFCRGKLVQAPASKRWAPDGPAVPSVARSGELKFDLASAATHGADDDLDVVAQLRHQFQQLGFADAAELAASDA